MMNQASTSRNSALNVHQDYNSFGFSHEDPLLNFSSHLLLDHDEFLFNTILPYQTPTPTPQPPPLPPKMEGQGKQKAVFVGPKDPNKRAGKKDRRSKIFTAQGPRDRRMRLSLQIARKFFDLQDMLGFDKASKTIEWLFNKSKAAIKDLAAQNNSNNIVNNNNNSNNIINTNNNHDNNNENNNDNHENITVEANKGGPRTKESRAKARERARKRTMEKLMMKKEGEKQNPNIRVEEMVRHKGVCFEDLHGKWASPGTSRPNNNIGYAQTPHVSTQSYGLLSREFN